jgi:hypothetical protein
MTTSKIGDARCLAFGRSCRIIRTDDGIAVVAAPPSVVLLGLVGDSQRIYDVRAWRLSRKNCEPVFR